MSTLSAKTADGNRILNYFADCNLSNSRRIGSHFTEDAAVYDLNHEPIRGRENIGAFWVNARERWGGAVWIVESLVEGNMTAAIEWAMVGGEDVNDILFRGSEHYSFHSGLIAEIRQYWIFPGRASVSQLRGYAYKPLPVEIVEAARGTQSSI